MCGIAGTLELGRESTEAATLDRMIGAVGHRGPDGIRVELSPPAGLAHARLRVIDLSQAADQPMWNEDRSVGVIFNGEIYNFRELRKELEALGYRFRTQSDTESILHLYEHLDAGAVARLDGMFALAIWDGHKRRLLLARDRAGKKPLFYYHDGRRFAFASEIKALHAHPDIPREPHLEALPCYLTYGYVPAPLTAYRGVHQIPPATLLTINDRHQIRQQRYWSPPFTTNGIQGLPEAKPQLCELMEKAVAKRLVSDVPLGAFLSGGMDSTIVVGVMSRLMRQPVKTFSIGFEGEPDFDETYYAEEAARRFRSDHTTFRVRPPDGEFLERLVHHHDGPFGDSSAIPTYIVSRLAREHVTVVLNGDGGDELFAGYHRFVAAVTSDRFPAWMRALGKRLGRWLPEPASSTHPVRRAKRFLEVASLPIEERFRVWCSFFPNVSRDLLLKPSTEDVARRVADHFGVPLAEASSATPLGRLLYLNFCTYLPEDLLVKMDRSTMAHGLEARSPFLDTDLIEFTAQLPDELKLNGLTTKYLLRESFKDIVPQSILQRGKMGFGVPLGSWFRGPLRPYLEDYLGRQEARIFEHLRRDTVASHLDGHLRGTHDFGHRLFCLLTLEIWLRTF